MSSTSHTTAIRTFLDAAVPPRLDYPDCQPISVRPYVPGLHSCPEIFGRIVTPYNAAAFEYFLRKHNLSSSYPLLVNNLRNGFPLGPMPPLKEPNIINNYASAIKQMDLIDEYLVDEVKSGRMDGPFSKEMVERILRGPFRSSPLVVVRQPEMPGKPDKIRICQHLSRNTKNVDSVNSFIKKADFPTRLDTLSRVAEVISLAPPGTEGCVLDIAKFHRTCPVLPDHKCWLVIQGRPNQFYIEHDHPFGAASASSNAGMIANAMVDIWMAEGVKPILKYEDDLTCFRYPTLNGTFTSNNRYRYDYDRESMLRRIAPLNVPWHPEKGTPAFTSTIAFLGLSWDLTKRTVCLPEEKRLLYLTRVGAFISLCRRGTCHLTDIEQIHGSLCYITFVYPDGRSRLPSLSNYAASYKGDEDIIRETPQPVVADVMWWKHTLSQIGIFRELVPRGPFIPKDIYVDASTSWGIAVIIGDRWAAFQLSPSWKEPGKEITWLETLAVEFAVYFLEAMGYHDASVRIHSDNQGTIGAVLKGRSTNYEINYSIRRSYTVLSALHLSPSFEFVPSSENPADPFSRGVPGSPNSRLTQTFCLPSELKSSFLPNPAFRL